MNPQSKMYYEVSKELQGRQKLRALRAAQCHLDCAKNDEWQSYRKIQNEILENLNQKYSVQ